MNSNDFSNTIDSHAIAKQFPLLQRCTDNGLPLIYLDSAATALKPQCVVDCVHEMLTQHTANIHRSVHILGDEATEAYEGARDIVAAFINAEPNEIVFLRNTTEALNLVANSCFAEGKILTTTGEHHSNFLPWSDQAVRLNVNHEGAIDLLELEQCLKDKAISLVSITHASNVTGVINDIQAICALAHQHDAKVLIDAAQSAPHTLIDVEVIDCDFLAFSGHKLGAPTGVGVLYGKADLLEKISPLLLGGSTVEEVNAKQVIYKNAPWKFEAGTPAIESVAGLSAALTFLMELDMEEVHKRFMELSLHTRNEINAKLSNAVLLGNKELAPAGPYSLSVKGISPHVIARGLSDRYGICARSGFHCAQPLHENLAVPPSLRLSFWIYNTEAEITKAVDGIAELIKLVDRQ